MITAEQIEQLPSGRVLKRWKTPKGKWEKMRVGTKSSHKTFKDVRHLIANKAQKTSGRRVYKHTGESMSYQVGDLFENTKTKKRSVLIAIKEDQHVFTVEGTNRKYQLTTAQMSNMIRLGPPEIPKQLPTVPEFLK